MTQGIDLYGITKAEVSQRKGEGYGGWYMLNRSKVDRNPFAGNGKLRA